MNFGKTLFAQLMEFVPWTSFAKIVARHGGDSGVRNLSCTEQFRAMAFAQLSYLESLRDIEACLLANQAKLYSMGSEVALFVGVTAIAIHIMIVAKVELHKFCNTQKIIKLSKELPTKSTESHKKGISELI